MTATQQQPEAGTVEAYVREHAGTQPAGEGAEAAHAPEGAPCDAPAPAHDAPGVGSEAPSADLLNALLDEPLDLEEELEREEAEADAARAHALDGAIAACLHAQAQIKGWGQYGEEIKATIRQLVELEAGPGFVLERYEAGAVRHKSYDEAHVSATDLMAAVGDLAGRGRFKSSADAQKLLALITTVHKDYIEVLQPLEDAPKRGAK